MNPASAINPARAHQCLAPEPASDWNVNDAVAAQSALIRELPCPAPSGPGPHAASAR
jgi:hypothetical protein